MKQWRKQSATEGKLKNQIKDAEAELDDAALAGNPDLTEDEVKSLEQLVARKRHLEQAGMQQMLTGSTPLI